ncbi:hypothetical protein MRX96_026779 [Rhipicephalus microplus]
MSVKALRSAKRRFDVHQIEYTYGRAMLNLRNRLPFLLALEIACSHERVGLATERQQNVAQEQNEHGGCENVDDTHGARAKQASSRSVGRVDLYIE